MPSKLTGVVRHTRFFQRSLRMQRRVHQRQHPAHAIANYRQIALAAVSHALTNAVRDEVEYVILELEMPVLGTRHAPIDQVHVVTLLEQELDKALTRRQIQ